MLRCPGMCLWLIRMALWSSCSGFCFNLGFFFFMTLLSFKSSERVTPQFGTFLCNKLLLSKSNPGPYSPVGELWNHVQGQEDNEITHLVKTTVTFLCLTQQHNGSNTGTKVKGEVEFFGRTHSPLIIYWTYSIVWKNQILQELLSSFWNNFFDVLNKLIWVINKLS